MRNLLDEVYVVDNVYHEIHKGIVVEIFEEEKK